MLFQVIETISLFVLETIETFGYIGVFVLMMMDNANVPIPSEIILPLAGFLASSGTFSFWPVVLMGILGSLAGSLISYGIMHHFGKRPLHFLARIHFLHPHHIDKAEAWFERYGEPSVFFARLVPALRTFISLPAGMFRMNLLRFSGLTLLGSFGWSLFLTYVGFVLGENWALVGEYIKLVEYMLVGVLVVFIGWWMYRNVWRSN